MQQGEYEAVIGLEIHAQLLTASKAFCSCPTTFGVPPNSSGCPVCLGLPGALPVLNRNLVEYIIRMGLATNCTVNHHSIFARKNYFYPDLPKGYQISQYEEPICSRGYVEIDLDDASRKRIGITRVHMEEDAGKLIHDQGAESLVDINRCGVPLIEIVSEPDLRSAREAYWYLIMMRQIVTYLGICDGNMEEGSLRCDANVSIRKKGEMAFGTKTELKNMNSFRNVERAVDFEINRQIASLREGIPIVQETLLWNADQNVAYPMRGKEEAHDYRYFPEPDLVPVIAEREWIEKIGAGLPEHPAVRRDRFMTQLGLRKYDADVLTAEKSTADYYEDTLGHLGAADKDMAKQAANWVMTDVLRVAGERKIGVEQFPVSPAHLAGMIALIGNGTISGKIAKEVFEEMLKTNESPSEIVERKGLEQLSDESAIEVVVAEVLKANPAQVEQYKAGSEKVFGFFVGQVMKATKGKANPVVANRLLKRLL